MIEFLKLFSNREISILIWVIIVFIVLIVKSKNSLIQLWKFIKIAFSKKFIPFYITFALYFSIIISLLKSFSIWELSLYKDFIYWFLTTGIVLFFSSTKLEKYKDFLKVISTAISATIILEFIINFYNFSLGWELIFIPVVTFISILAFYAEAQKKDRNSDLVAKFLKGILSIIGIGILAYSIYRLIITYEEILSLSNLKSFLLPPIFTLAFLPLIYFTVLYIKYEKTFGNLNRYKFLSDSRKRKIRYSILKYANINFNRIEKANKIILFQKETLQNETNIKSYLRQTLRKSR